MKKISTDIYTFSAPRKVYKIGCAFDCDRRNLGQWLVK